MKFAKIRIVNILIVFDSANKNYVKKTFSHFSTKKRPIPLFNYTSLLSLYNSHTGQKDIFYE